MVFLIAPDAETQAPQIRNGDFDVHSLLKEMSLKEKATLLAGRSMFTTTPVPSKGLPALVVSDGPSTCRGPCVFNGPPGNCFPAAVGLAATFDVDLLQEVGAAIGEEARAKHVHVLFGPTVNIHRSPLSGRAFEFFSEDPHLSGQLAGAYIAACQAKGVAACVKHFVGNEQEWDKHRTTSVITKRALREIFLEAFRVATKIGKPWSYMTSYNLVDDIHMGENKELISGVLRGEWGWEGAIMSDYMGCHSCAGSIKAGLDIEMQGPPVWRGPWQIMRMVMCGKLTEADVDARARNVLVLLKRAIQSGIPFDFPFEEEYHHLNLPHLDTTYTRGLLRRAAAASTILLKNERGLLPIRAGIKKIAVFGLHADMHFASGGGAASVHRHTFVSTPLDAIKEAAKEIGAEVEYSIGSEGYLYVPYAHRYLQHPDGLPASEAVIKLEFWKEQPSPDWKSRDAAHVSVSGKPDYVLHFDSAKCFMEDGLPKDIQNGARFVRCTADFVPTTNGDWQFGYAALDAANVFMDDEVLIAYDDPIPKGALFYGNCQEERRAVRKDLTAGRKYRIQVRTWHQYFLTGFPLGMPSAFRFGAATATPPDELIRQAVEVAKKSDVAIAMVGLHEDYEQEGYDRLSMSLPGTNDQLVSALLAANPNTIVINTSGTPVEMPWADQASTVIQSFYAGTAVGAGLADVIFGKVNPSGKLPVTFPRIIEDTPSFLGFASTQTGARKVFYQEDIFVGYRHFDRSRTKPRFPFGHGLSYTTFEYADLEVPAVVDLSSGDKARFAVRFTVKNTGTLAGKEAAQVYVHDVSSTLPRPIKELKGFAVADLQPGQSKQVTVDLDRNAWAYWDDLGEGCWTAEKGGFEIHVGSSSENIHLIAKTKLDQTITWR